MSFRKIKKVFLFVIVGFSLALIGCGTSEPKQPKKQAKKTLSQKKASSPIEQRKKLEQELLTAKENVEGALKVRDWPIAEKLIEESLKKTDLAEPEYQVWRARFLLLKGTLLRDQSDEVSARRYYADAMAIFRVHENDVGRFEVHLAQCELEEAKGDYSAADRELEEAGDLLQQVEDKRLKAEYLLKKGRLASLQVRYDEAYESILEASRTFADAKDKESQAESLLLLATVEDSLGNTDQSKRSLEKALSIFKEHENKDGQVRALHRLAALAEREKKYSTARSILKKVHELYEDLDRTADSVKVQRQINALPE